MRLLLWNHAEEHRHRWRNRVQTVMLLAGMAAVLAACGWTIAGPDGVVWVVVGGGLGLLFAPTLSPALLLRLYRAQPVAAWQWPEIYQVLEQLRQAAGLERVPVLHVIASPVPNAFAVGNVARAAIAVTDGMLARLDLRELTGVLAHEVSHIRHGDIRILGLADVISRLTRVMSWVGMLLLVFSLPMLVGGQAGVPPLLVLLLLASPTLSALMQLALSRTREFDADLDAASLTGDPQALISALQKMEMPVGGLWGRILTPHRQPREPSLLRTHPSTAERVERLRALVVPFHPDGGSGPWGYSGRR